MAKNIRNQYIAPKYDFIYSNLSPLYSSKIEKENIKNILVTYAFNNNLIVSSLFSKSDIESKYGILSNKNDYSALHEILDTLYL